MVSNCIADHQALDSRRDLCEISKFWWPSKLAKIRDFLAAETCCDLTEIQKLTNIMGRSLQSWWDLVNIGEISVKVFHGTGYNIATTCTVCTCKQLYGNLFTAFINYFFLQLNMLKGKVKDITFKGTVDMLKSCALQNGKVPLVSIRLSVQQ